MVWKAKRNATSVAKKPKVSKAVKKYVKKAMDKDGELKQLAINFSPGALLGTVISTTVGTQYTFNQVPTIGAGAPGNQGVGGYQRIGNKISIEQFSVSFSVQLIRSNIAATPSGHEYFRCIIYVEKFPEGTLTTSSEMLYDVGSGLGAFSPYIQSNKHRFTILHDKCYNLFSLDNTYPASGALQHVQFKHRFKRPLITTYYPDTVATGIQSIETGAIKMLLFSSVMSTGTGGAAVPLYLAGSFYSNILYRDD